MHLPVVFRHTRNHMVMCQMPSGTHKAIFYPHIRILLSKRNLYKGILYEDRGMRLTIDMHYLALVDHKVL